MLIFTQFIQHFCQKNHKKRLVFPQNQFSVFEKKLNFEDTSKLIKFKGRKSFSIKRYDAQDTINGSFSKNLF